MKKWFAERVRAPDLRIYQMAICGPALGSFPRRLRAAIHRALEEDFKTTVSVFDEMTSIHELATVYNANVLRWLEGRGRTTAWWSATTRKAERARKKTIEDFCSACGRWASDLKKREMKEKGAVTYRARYRLHGAMEVTAHRVVAHGSKITFVSDGQEVTEPYENHGPLDAVFHSRNFGAARDFLSRTAYAELDAAKGKVREAQVRFQFAGKIPCPEVGEKDRNVVAASSVLPAHDRGQETTAKETPCLNPSSSSPQS